MVVGLKARLIQTSRRSWRLGPRKRASRLTDVLQEGLFLSQKIGKLESRIDDVLRENRELKTQLGRVNRKPKMTKRASIPLTLKEWDALDTAAHRAKMQVRSAALGSGRLQGDSGVNR